MEQEQWEEALERVRRVAAACAEGDLVRLRIDEPAADLGIAMAVISSARDLPVEPHTAFIGEVGLGGEVRAVSQVERRVQEAARLGFRRIFVPQHSRRGLKAGAVEIAGAERLMDCIVKAFGAAKQ